jgi:hypothetical protein
MRPIQASVADVILTVRERIEGTAVRVSHSRNAAGRILLD